MSGPVVYMGQCIISHRKVSIDPGSMSAVKLSCVNDGPTHDSCNLHIFKGSPKLLSSVNQDVQGSTPELCGVGNCFLLLPPCGPSPQCLHQHLYFSLLGTIFNSYCSRLTEKLPHCNILIFCHFRHFQPLKLTPHGLISTFYTESALT